MKILEIILLEYILGYVLQGFAYCLGIYAFSIRKIDSKYIIAGISLIVLSYIMRLLPVSFGVHTILILVCLFLISIFYLKLPAFAAIRSILIITVLLLMIELISVVLINLVVGEEQVNNMMQTNLGRSIIALPSSVIFAVIAVVSYFVLRKVKKKKSEKNGEGCA